ncbi:MAG: IS200/IS605 family accessory protein TnpB-related protein [Candidatus Methanospirare jalkutatii]|nr:IS200/IS605 family accessory protein TnpB-related protein [Candidatus Methanospirare jalkutatii]
MVKVTIPGYICEISEEDREELEKLLFKFGKACRRAYSLKRNGYTKSEIEKILQDEICLNARYIKDAYHSVKDLPPHVTFGGLKNQRLREKGKISKEEYHRRRNSIVISRGEKSKNGNLNMRLDLERMELRINTGEDRKWIYPKVYIPKKYLEKYGHLLDGSTPYTVLIKRRNDGYDVRITVEVQTEVKEGKRVLALDVNAGHIDFAVVEKEEPKVIATGRVEVHETQFVRKGKRAYRIHQAVDKIGNIAKHYDADVVVGKLNTGSFHSNNRKANREVKNMPQYKFRQTLKKLERKGIKVEEKSEKNTSKVGEKISALVGLDVHKCSAIAFAVKSINYNLFRHLITLLSVASSNEGDGSPRGWRKRGKRADCPCSGHKLWTAPQSGYPAMPGSWGLSFLERLRAGLTCLHVKVC